VLALTILAQRKHAARCFNDNLDGTLTDLGPWSREPLDVYCYPKPSYVVEQRLFDELDNLTMEGYTMTAYNPWDSTEKFGVQQSPSPPPDISDELSDAPSWEENSNLWGQLQSYFGPAWQQKDPPNGKINKLLDLPQQRDIEWRSDEKPATDIVRVKSTILQVVGEVPARPCNRCIDGRGPFNQCIIIGANAGPDLHETFSCCANCYWSISGGRKHCSLNTTPVRLRKAQDANDNANVDDTGKQEHDDEATLYDEPKSTGKKAGSNKRKLADSSIQADSLSQPGPLTPSTPSFSHTSSSQNGLQGGVRQMTPPSSSSHSFDYTEATFGSPCERLSKRRKALPSKKPQPSPFLLDASSVQSSSGATPLVLGFSVLQGSPIRFDNRLSISMLQLAPGTSQSMQFHSVSTRTHQIGVVGQGNAKLLTGPIASEPQTFVLTTGQSFRIIPGNVATLSNVGDVQVEITVFSAVL
jgi:hypothetical protein